MLLVPRLPVALTGASLLLPGDRQAGLHDWRNGAADAGGGRNAPVAPAFGPQITDLRRPSGVKRPSSASDSAVAAGFACQALTASRGWNAERLGVVAASTTAAAAVSIQFDRRGLEESWQAVDPLAFPSTLPSAVATQVATAIGAKAAAWTSVLHAIGIFNAVEAAILMLQGGEADAVLLVAAEQRNAAQPLAERALDVRLQAGEMAAALAIERDADAGVAVAFLAYGPPGGVSVPSGWEDAPRVALAEGARFNAMANAAAMVALIDAVSAMRERLLLSADVAGLGSAAIGLHRTQRPG